MKGYMPIGRLRRVLAQRRGSALVLAILVAMVILLISLAGGKLLETSSRETNINKNVLTEADNVARAGLVDAMAWFRRQNSGTAVKSGTSVTHNYYDKAFYPRYNADPAKSATIDETLGLVKEYRMSDDGDKWARYEVLRQKDPFYYPLDPHAVHDITAQRMVGHSAGEGLVWYLESAGYVFKKVDPAKAYNVPPNRVLAKVRASTEIRRIAITPPDTAAFMVGNGGNCSSDPCKTVRIYNGGKITGGTAYGAWRRNGQPPLVSGSGVITGSPQNTKSGSTDLTLVNVMEMTTDELKLLADYVVTDTSELPATLPSLSLIYVDGNAVFSSTRPLSGLGFLYVKGNLTIQAGSNSVFSGIVFVEGNSVVADPALITGTFIGIGGLTLGRTSATDVAEIRYDESVLSIINQQICQYRENKSTLHVFIGVPALEK